MATPEPNPHQSSDPIAEIRRRSRNALLWSLLAVVGVTATVLAIAYGPKKNGAPAPLRAVLDANGAISQALSSNSNKAETFPRSAAEKPRFNGDIGMESDFDPKTWKLHVEGGRNDHDLVISDLDTLPQTEIIAKFKCIEGWSQVVQAKGIRFSEFLGKYGPDLGHPGPATEADLPKLPKWVGLQTPNGKYYVGIDMKSMLHPQTILCWEMDGKPLPMEQGYPLRLVIPIKYGIKSIKRIGTLTLTNTRPPDYWFERGYDYYAGH